VTVGEVIADRYELEELCGTGGMSSVYKARDRLLERHVALKILHSHHAEDEEFVERFRREARAVAQLSHPNIVTVIDRGEDDGRQFIVFEHVDGENLKELVQREGALPVRRAIELGLEVGRGLAFAHGMGLVHRDVKPQNVLMNGDGRAKVTDFGIARSIDVDQGVTQTGTVLGTSSYIAPEQARGQRVDAHTDVYSLGVVLYELLTGEVPFPGEGFVAVAMKHVHEPAPSVLQLRPDCPPRLAAAVARALEKEPEARFPSMDAFVAELQECLAEIVGEDTDPDATMIVAPASAAAFRQPERRSVPGNAPRGGRAWPLLLVLLLALALAGGAAYYLTHRHHAAAGATGGGGGPAPSRPVPLRGLTAYDPEGDHAEHNSDAVYAADGNPSTYWGTEHYRSFTKSGVGVVLDAGRSARVRTVVVTSDTPGFTAQIQAGSSPAGGFQPVSPSRTVNGTTAFPIHGGPARYYLVWITKLPPGSDVAHVNEVKAKT
jgi:serine/threonine-protein kinase